MLKLKYLREEIRKTLITKQDKKNNQFLSKERVINENVIGLLKRFKILADRYRNRRKRFGLRFKFNCWNL